VGYADLSDSSGGDSDVDESTYAELKKVPQWVPHAANPYETC